MRRNKIIYNTYDKALYIHYLSKFNPSRFYIEICPINAARRDSLVKIMNGKSPASSIRSDYNYIYRYLLDDLAFCSESAPCYMVGDYGHQSHVMSLGSLHECRNRAHYVSFFDVWCIMYGVYGQSIFILGVLEQEYNITKKKEIYEKATIKGTTYWKFWAP